MTDSWSGHLSRSWSEAGPCHWNTLEKCLCIDGSHLVCVVCSAAGKFLVSGQDQHYITVVKRLDFVNASDRWIHPGEETRILHLAVRCWSYQLDHFCVHLLGL